MYIENAEYKYKMMHTLTWMGTNYLLPIFTYFQTRFYQETTFNNSHALNKIFIKKKKSDKKKKKKSEVWAIYF